MVQAPTLPFSHMTLHIPAADFRLEVANRGSYSLGLGTPKRTSSTALTFVRAISCLLGLSTSGWAWAVWDRQRKSQTASKKFIVRCNGKKQKMRGRTASGGSRTPHELRRNFLGPRCTDDPGKLLSLFLRFASSPPFPFLPQARLMIGALVHPLEPCWPWGEPLRSAINTQITFV